MEAQPAPPTNAADIPHRSTSSWGLLGPFSPEIFNRIFAHLDVRTLLAAHNVCRMWRRYLEPRWKDIYLSFNRVDSTIKWRMRSLDGDEGFSREEYRDEGLIPMTEEGDGRGVSGPPLDPVARVQLALASAWSDEVRTEIENKLPSDSSLREEVLGYPQQTKNISLEDRVYQWGTRLDKPDWHQLCALHAATERNLKYGRNVHTKLVPLYVPDDQSLCMAGVDAGDDCLVFRHEASMYPGRDPWKTWQSWWVFVECSTGQVRYFSLNKERNFQRVQYQCIENIGMSGISGYGSTGPELSGQAVNRLVRPETGNRFIGAPPDRHLFSIAKVNYKGELSFRNFKDQTLEVAKVDSLDGHTTLLWGKLSSLVGEQPAWDHSVKGAVTRSHLPIILTDRYVVGQGVNTPQLLVYSKADESLVASIPAGISRQGPSSDESTPVALFSFSLTMFFAHDGSDLLVCPFSLRPQMACEDGYWRDVRDAILDCPDPNLPIDHLAFSGKHLFLEVTCGYLVIPNFDSVVAQAELEHPSERSRFIALRTILIRTRPNPFHTPPSRVSAGRLIFGMSEEAALKGFNQTLILDINSLPPLDPASPARPRLRGVAITTPRLKGAASIGFLVSGGRIFELIMMGRKYMLRITSFVPQSHEEEQRARLVGDGLAGLNLWRSLDRQGCLE